jgi:sugar O-acyltransferase (sialic acid O-acetyltransferase NeuD family)
MYILGAGTLGEIALETARRAGMPVDGFYDDVTQESTIDGVPVLGGFAELGNRPSLAGTDVFVAIGDNAKRAAHSLALSARGGRLANLVDPSAVVSPSATIGSGNLVLPGAYLGPKVRLGSGNLVFPGVSITHHNVVGDYCFFSPNASVGGFTRLGDRCKIGMNCVVLPYREVPADTEAHPLTVVEGNPS